MDETLESAAKKIGDALQFDLSYLSRFGIFTPLSRWDKWRVKFWFFWGNQRRAQIIILENIKKEMSNK